MGYTGPFGESSADCALTLATPPRATLPGCLASGRSLPRWKRHACVARSASATQSSFTAAYTCSLFHLSLSLSLSLSLPHSTPVASCSHFLQQQESLLWSFPPRRLNPNCVSLMLRRRLASTQMCKRSMPPRVRLAAMRRCTPAASWRATRTWPPVPRGLAPRVTPLSWGRVLARTSPWPSPFLQPYPSVAVDIDRMEEFSELDRAMEALTSDVAEYVLI